MLSIAMVIGYNCKAITSHLDCGSTQEAQCSLRKTVVNGSNCDCVYCAPIAYELNRPVACTLNYMWNVGDIKSSSTFAAVNFFTE